MTSASNAGESTNGAADLQSFISRHCARIEPLNRQVALAEWAMQTTASAEALADSERLTSELCRIYTDSAAFEALRALASVAIDDPLLARQRDILLNHFRAAQMEPATSDQIVHMERAIEQTLTTFRARLRGEPVSDNEIDSRLTHSKDSGERKAAWEASKQIGDQVAAPVLDLVRVRNREARRQGFDNYYTRQLELQELDTDRLFDLLDSLETRTREQWSAYISAINRKLEERFQLPHGGVRPWHFQNRFFQNPEEESDAAPEDVFAGSDITAMAAKFFAAIGMPIEDLIEKADLLERPGKCQHAFCMDIDRRGDTRVLCNIRPTRQWTATLLHEFGHAVYNKYCDPDLPYLLRCPAHALTTEAVALYMGRMADDADWLRLYAGIDAHAASKYASAQKRQTAERLMVFLRFCLVMCHFERALYADPEQDLNTLWWDLVEKYQSVRRPEGRDAPDWAAKMHLATAPVYYQNYILGELAASQIVHTVTETVAGGSADRRVTDPAVGAFFRQKVFGPGAAYRWDDWLALATGEPLNPEYFTKQLDADNEKRPSAA